MKAPLERIRVSQRSRDTLVTLKRRTGIEHWNVLCRWAFLDSLANPNVPIPAKNLPESNLEMHWDVFVGDFSEPLLAAFAIRVSKDGVKPTKVDLADYFRSHLERGISQLQSAANLPELLKRTKAGKDLEARFGSSTAGALIYAASRPGKRVPDFFADNEAALVSIREDAK